MTGERQSTLEATGIEWPASRHHIPWVAHVIRLALGTFMNNPKVKGCTMTWEAREHNHQIWRQWMLRHWKESKTSERAQYWNEQAVGNETWFRKDNSETTYFKKFWMSWYWPSYSGECMLYWLRWHQVGVHWLSKIQSTHCGTTYSGFEHTVELDTGVAWVSLPIMRIHPQVAQECKILRLHQIFTVQDKCTIV